MTLIKSSSSSKKHEKQGLCGMMRHQFSYNVLMFNSSCRKSNSTAAFFFGQHFSDVQENVHEGNSNIHGGWSL